MEVVLVDPRILKPHPEYHKAHTELPSTDPRYEFIKMSVQAMGIETALHVQTGTNIILAGHLRQRIALELDLKEVPVVYYDVDDNKARYMMVIDNYQRIDASKDVDAWTKVLEMTKSRRERREAGNENNEHQ